MATRARTKRSSKKNVVEGLPIQAIDTHFQPSAKRSRTRRASITKQSAHETVTMQLPRENLLLWEFVGKEHGLTDNADIAVFLLRWYQRSVGQQAQCTVCQQPILHFPTRCAACSALTTQPASGSSGDVESTQIKTENQRCIQQSPSTFLPSDQLPSILLSSSSTTAEAGHQMPVAADQTPSQEDQSSDASDDDSSDTEETLPKRDLRERQQPRSSEKTEAKGTHLSEVKKPDTRCEEVGKQKVEKQQLQLHCFGDDCQGVFGTFRTFLKHYQTAHCKRVKLNSLDCPLCQTTAAKKQDLARHLFYKHAPPSVLHMAAVSFVCELCGRTFDDIKKRWKHIKSVHHRDYMCELCGRRFGHGGKLRLHRQRCSNRKCSFCSMMVPISRHMKSHVLKCPMNPSVMQQVPCQATDCHKVYRTRKMMMRHYRSVHLAELHQCTTCGKTFSWQNNLLRHRRSCGVDKDETQLAKDRLKTVTCQADSCSHRFETKRQMKRHYLGMHCGRRFSCCECGKQYNWSTSLHRHRLKECGLVQRHCAKSNCDTLTSAYNANSTGSVNSVVNTTTNSVCMNVPNTSAAANINIPDFTTNVNVVNLNSPDLTYANIDVMGSVNPSIKTNLIPANVMVNLATMTAVNGNVSGVGDMDSVMTNMNSAGLNTMVYKDEQERQPHLLSLDIH